MNPPQISLRCFRTRRLIRCGLIFLTAALSGIPLHATTVVAPEFNQLVGQADYIVRAVVKSVTSEVKTSGIHRHILTQVELEVREVISGTPPTPLILQMVGGKVGSEEMTVEGAPKFQVGDEDILFVHGNGRQMNPLVALMHGRYPIKHDTATGREYVSRSNGEPLASEKQVSRPMAAKTVNAETAPASSPTISQSLSPSEFTDRIKSALKQNSRPASEN